MAKYRVRRMLPKPILVILALSLVISVAYVSLRSYFTPKPTEIMAITPATLTYGQTTVSGILQKDSPIGTKGNYILALPDMRAILLDIQGIDNLIGKSVSVSGVLSPAKNPRSPMSMKVSQIIAK